jgi:hypothetical protein
VLSLIDSNLEFDPNSIAAKSLPCSLFLFLLLHAQPQKPNSSNQYQTPNADQDHQDNHLPPITLRARGREVEQEEALGSSLVGGSVHVRESGGVNRGVGGAVGEVSDGGSGEVRGRYAGEAGGAGGAGGVVLERLVTVVDDVVEGLVGDFGFELCSCGDVHAALGDPLGLEPARGSDVEARGEIVDEGLVIGPARLGRVEWGHERAIESEVVGLDEPEALADVLAVVGAHVQFGIFGALDQLPEDAEVERALSGAILGKGFGRQDCQSQSQSYEEAKMEEGH